MGGRRIKKRGTCPTLEQKKIIAQQDYHGKKLDPKNWLIIKETKDELLILNKLSFHKYVIKKSCL